MFCTHCGSRLSDSAKFCTKCGSPVIAISVPRPAPETSPARVQQTLPVQKEPVPARPYGQQTGVIPVPVQQASAAPARKSVSQQSPVQPVHGSGPSQNPSAPVSKAQPVPQVFRFAAPAFAGEAAVGSLGNPAAAISELTATPGQVLTGSFRSFFSSLAAIFKKPKQLIAPLALSFVWLVLGILKTKDVDFLPAEILSFLTFAEGGLSGGFLARLGGLLGKGAVAGALVSLISMIRGMIQKKGDSERSFQQTLSGVFGVTGFTVWAYLTGAGAAVLLYLFFSGGNVKGGFMCGCAAAFLSARAAVGSGFLKNLPGSFTKRKSAGPRITGFIRGLTAGFAAASLFGLTGSLPAVVILGLLLLTGGGTMLILQAAGVVRTGKEESAA